MLIAAAICGFASAAAADRIVVRGSGSSVRIVPQQQVIRTPTGFMPMFVPGFAQRRLFSNRFGGPYAYAGYPSYGGDYVAPAPAVAPAPMVIFAQPPAPPRPTAELRPSVETTDTGVTIIRGPGSRHLGY